MDETTDGWMHYVSNYYFNPGKITSRILSPEEPIIFFLKKNAFCERSMLFFLVFYAPIMYAHAYTLHDVLLLCNTTNLRISSPLRGDSIKRWFTIRVYAKSKHKLHSNLGRKMKKMANNTKKKKKIIAIIAKSSKKYSTS